LLERGALSSDVLLRATWWRVLRLACCDLRLLNLDLDVHTSRQIELRQRIDRLGATVEDVDHPLVRLQLELLARLLVDVRRTMSAAA
jgi:hypothetical protein